MGQRASEYDRIDGDTYVTPQWVWDELYSVEPKFKLAWDCAPANAEYDFLQCESTAGSNIATNPPFKLSVKFVRHALLLTRSFNNAVAMLLPMEWDCAKGRVDLFDGPPFKAKYVIQTRIRWTNLEQKKNGPSKNHAWYVWDWAYRGQPTMGWIGR